MLFTDDLLFIHVPKTAGMAITRLLLDVLPRPVYYTHPLDGQPTGGDGVIELVGERHETLSEAKEFVAGAGIDFDALPLILAVIRDPYDLEVSRYAYLQLAYAWNDGWNQDLALHEDFETFAVESASHGGNERPFEDYFLLDGEMPPNLRVVRYESLDSELRDALATIGIEGDLSLRVDNESRRDHYYGYYTPEAERAVYERYRFAFDGGFYVRLSERLPPPKGAVTYGHRIPLDGPVRQVGPSSGLWPDLWVGSSLRFRVRAELAVRQVTVDGWFPDPFLSGDELTLSFGDESRRRPLEGQGVFSFTVPCSIGPGERVDMQLRILRTWRPATGEGSTDDRELSFVLDRVSFAAERSNEDWNGTRA